MQNGRSGQIQDLVQRRDQWQPPPHQPTFLRLHNKSILEYAAALRDRRIDPTYFPVVRQYAWTRYDTISKYYPKPHSFPLLPAANRFCIEKYFLSSLCHAINLYKGVPDIACRLLSKFAHTLILCIEVFEKQLPHNKPWEIMLEGNHFLAFDL